MAGTPDIEALAALLLGAREAVVLTGLALGRPEDPALSDPDGAWAQRASLEAFLTDPAAFWDFYLPAADAVAAREPTAAHHALARLQRAGIVAHLVTQAVDRLHTRAGSPEVVEVYGNMATARCERCGEVYGLPEVRAMRDAAEDRVPRCTAPACRYPVRPSGTLWNEPLPAAAVARAWELAAHADLFLVLDSSLRTIPISLLPSVPLTRQVPLAIVGETPTSYDRYAHVVSRGPSSPLLEALAGMLCPEDPAG